MELIGHSWFIPVVRQHFHSNNVALWMTNKHKLELFLKTYEYCIHRTWVTQDQNSILCYSQHAWCVLEYVYGKELLGRMCVLATRHAKF